MRIAFVLAGGLHPSGRTEVTPALVGLLECLATRHEVHAFTTRHLAEPASYTLRGILVHDLGSPIRVGAMGRWREWRALESAIARSGPFDVVHGYQADPGVLAAVAGRRMKVPSVVTCDSGEFVALPEIDYGMQRSWRTRLLVGGACRLATRLHVATRYMESLARACGYGATCIPIGVDTRAFAPARTRGDGPPWRLLNIASINAVKDQRTLLDAVAAASRDLDVRLDVIGEDTLARALHEYAALLRVDDRITFHGYLPHDELPRFHREAHLYVQSSRHEAACAAVMEAAASGLPIVGTRVGYVADWAPHGAVAVNPGDAAALARAIVGTLRDRTLRERLTSVAQSFAEQHDVAWTARELERLYASTRGR